MFGDQGKRKNSDFETETVQVQKIVQYNGKATVLQ